MVHSPKTPVSAPTHHSESPGPDLHSSSPQQQDTTAPLNSKKPARTPEEKKQRDLIKYKLLPPCNCRKNCLSKIPEERRQQIHDQFWNEEYSVRRAWLFAHVKTSEPQRSRKFGATDTQRKTSRFYILPDDDGNDVFVCKVFFLRTLGYKSDKIITVTSPSFT